MLKCCLYEATIKVRVPVLVGPEKRKYRFNIHKKHLMPIDITNEMAHGINFFFFFSNTFTYIKTGFIINLNYAYLY